MLNAFPGRRPRGVSWPVSATCDVRCRLRSSKSFEDCCLGLGLEKLVSSAGADAEIGPLSSVLFDRFEDSLLDMSSP